MRYEIIIKPSAEKSMDKIPLPARRRVADALQCLRTNPRPAGVTKLVGDEDLWRIRVGNYRVVYDICDDRLVVLVLRVAHRRDVYRP